MSQTENSPEIDLSYYLQILLFRWSRNLHRLIERGGLFWLHVSCKWGCASVAKLQREQ